MFGRRDKPEMEQQGGPESTNVQALRDVVVVQGSSPEQVRDIVSEAIRANALQMRSVAAQVVEERIEHFSERLVQRLAREDAELTAATSDPDVQYAIVQAGIGYARTGDDDLAGVLVDLIADRARVETRSLLAVVIDDAVTVAPRLTDGELAILTLFWRLVHTQDQSLNDLDRLSQWVQREVAPLVPYLPRGDASYLHLQALGCANVQVTSIPFRDVWTKTYAGLFAEGFEDAEVPETLLESARSLDAPPLFISSLRDPARRQVNALNEEGFDAVHGARLHETELPQAKALLARTLSDEKLLDALGAVDPAVRVLHDIWQSTPMQSLRLSAVGIAVAHANWRHLTGAGAPLSVWISEDAS